ncbi:protein PRRC1-like isoform X2 [Oppia nitens]|uniref:protein PRRC1-like isoform X2 n=1 Tax=Oppia nitens TaxID=1686743 RepID=UPI0023DA2ABE|nr:protein PRRC1-like isoform X2 [Oppia nitens]
MSETSSSDTNGDNSFHFITDKEVINGSNNAVTGTTPSISMTSSTSSTYDQQLPTPPDIRSLTVSSPIVISSASEVKPPESQSPPSPTINVNLNETTSGNQSPKSRSESMGSVFIDWIANNDFITRMATKAKNSVDTVITTLDPGMKEIIYSGGDINIMVTSDKESKIIPIREAFQKVFGRATVSGMSAQSLSIANQPVGYENGRKAAKERIQSLRMNTSAIPQNQVIVSVESFIVDVLPDKWYEMACLVLEDPVMAINLEVFTQLTPIPNECINQLRFETPIDYAFRSSGYSLTVGAVMSQKLNVQPEEWHESWIGIPRKDIIQQSVTAIAHIYKNRLIR